MNKGRMLDGQPIHISFVLGCESLCPAKNVGMYPASHPTCNMGLDDAFTQKNLVIRDVPKGTLATRRID